MIYQAVFRNKRDAPGGAMVTIFLHDFDTTNVFPNAKIERQFPGTVVADLTQAFLDNAVKLTIAKQIEAVVADRASAVLNNIVATQWAAVMPAAYTTFKNNTQAAFAANGITAQAIHDRITNAWTANGVTGQLTDPVITHSFDQPIMNAPNNPVTVYASNP